MSDEFSTAADDKVDLVEITRDDLPFERSVLIDVQAADHTLSSCIASAVEPNVLSEHSVACVVDDGVLMRKWSPRNTIDDLRTTFQVEKKC